VAKKVITVCDICDSDRDVQQWEIKGEEGKAKPELCGTHSAPLKRLLNAQAEGTADAPQTRARGRGRQSRYVVTDETPATG